MLPALLLATSALPFIQAASGDWTPPWFCHSNECPKFTVTDNHTEYEKRHYEPSVWVSTKFDNIKFDQSVNSAMFFKLFHYIDGGNVLSKKIAMTSPVLVELVLLPGDKANATMGFMVPFDFQANPPAPSDSTLFIDRKQAMDVYVLSYGGYSTDNVRDSEFHLLSKDLIRDGANQKYDTSRYMTAGYDGPFTFSHRHNEIWLMATA